MMILRSAVPSPFGRKVKIALRLLGLAEKVRFEPADSNNPDDALLHLNPLGKIPILVLDSGETLFNSRVILEYLDDFAGGGRIVPAGAARWPALRLQALADGIMDAALLQIYEGRFRPQEKHHQPWLDRQAGKVARALAALEAAPPEIGAHPHVGHVALACALGYLDFRFAGRWRDGHPRLVAWLDHFAAAVPAYAETAPTG